MTNKNKEEDDKRAETTQQQDDSKTHKSTSTADKSSSEKSMQADNVSSGKRLVSADDKSSDQPKVPTAVPMIDRWFPFASWIKKYNWGKDGSKDAIAAISVVALLIPESMGLASSAGLPVQIGLYAAPLALIAYALFGGSRALVVGVTGSVAAVTTTAISTLSGGDAARGVAIGAALAITGGIILYLAGLLKLGWIVNFISHSVMTGVIVGMSVQIIIGQIPKLVGIEAPKGVPLVKLWETLSSFPKWNFGTLAVGIVGMIILLVVERYFAKIPAGLVIVILGSVLVAVFGMKLEIVPPIPSGPPTLAMPTGINVEDITQLIFFGIIIAFVCFSESSGASAVANKVTHDDLNVDQEFRAFGLSNIGAGILGGMCVSGSLSKTSVAITAKAVSQMSNIFCAFLVLIVLVFLAPAFQWLPEVALAVIVIASIRKSANPAQFVKLWKMFRVPAINGIVTAFVVLSVGLMPAIIFGVSWSILQVIYNLAFPGSAQLGQDPKSKEFYPLSIDIGTSINFDVDYNSEKLPEILIFRFGAPIIYPNAETFVSRIKQKLIECAEKNDNTRVLIIDCELVTFIDITGAGAVVSVIDYCKTYGIEVYVARLHEMAMTVILRDPDLQSLCEQRTFHNLHLAVEAAEQFIHKSNENEKKG